MEFDLSTPEGIRALQRHLKKLSASDALRIIQENERGAADQVFTRSISIPEGAKGIRVTEGEQRTFDVSFSSEEPVQRYFGNEVLSHEKGAVDLKWLRSGNAPLLWMHDGRQHVGVVTKASLDTDAKRCDARCRCANDLEGDRYFNRVSEGIIRNTSVGYSIQEWERIDDPKDEEAPPTYRATKWKPHEVSLVSTPADESVGVGRARSFRVPDTKTLPEKPIVTLPTRTIMTPEEIAAAAEASRKIAADLTAAKAAERARVNAIFSLRNRYDPDGSKITDAEFRSFADDETKGELEFRRFLETKNATEVRAAPLTGTPGVGQVIEARDRMPLLYALRELVSGGAINQKLLDEDKRLRAASTSAFGSGARSAGQLVVPSEFIRHSNYRPERDLSQGVRGAENAQQFANGGALVGMQFAPTIIEYLRPMPVMEKAGAIRMSGITGGPGTIRFPKQVGDIYGTWAASQVSSSASTLPFGAVDATPKRLIAQIQIDKQLLLQESFDVEAYMRNSVNKQFALSLDLAGLIGIGNGMPLGILNTPNINSGAVTFNGPSAASGTLAPQYNNFLLFLSTVLAANAGGLGKRCYITSPQSMINWAGVPKATPAATQTVNDKWMLEFGMGGKEFSVLGEEVLESTYLHALPTGYTSAGFTLAVPDLAIYGPFNQYMFIEWAGMEVIYDPYTQAAKDLIVITFRMYADGICQQPTAFVTSSNAGNVVYV